MRFGKWMVLAGILLGLVSLDPGYAAYDHGGADTDSGTFLAAHPDKVGTKLDSCALCHTGGQYEKDPGQWVSLGSCQWCHYKYKYDASGEIGDTLNPYGIDYNTYGRAEGAIDAIAALDSDGDGFSNGDEIAALRFPGNADDDPTRVPAPSRIFTREELAQVAPHTQFMLMNTHKSGDFYVEYSGMPVVDLLELAGMLTSATGITVFAPDGWSQYHPLDVDPDPLFYHVRGGYPQADYYYDCQADIDCTLEGDTDADGWCDYSAPSCDAWTPGDPIVNPDGLKMILALRRDGQYLDAGRLTDTNKLDGEGPFRVVPPQKLPGPPDQSVKSDNQEVLWPFDDTADHNAGFATRSATMIKVAPLPEGTTDIDTLEAGWEFVDEGKILVYGAVDPLPGIEEKLEALVDMLRGQDAAHFKRPALKRVLLSKIARVRRMIRNGAYAGALAKIQGDILRKIDGCQTGDRPVRNDWIIDCGLQRTAYWAVHEIVVFLKILG